MSTIWLTYDPDEGFEEHPDEALGREALASLLDSHQQAATECVHHEVERAALYRCERVAHIRQTVTARAEDQTEDGATCRAQGWDFMVSLDLADG
jgi:hypothetical protein